MGVFTHVRFKFWDTDQYTPAQAQEMRELHRLYGQHLAKYKPIQDSLFALREAGNFFYPQHHGTQDTGSKENPIESKALGELTQFAESLADSVRVFTHRREQRWYRKGHENDPTRLFCSFLMQFSHDILARAPCTQATLDYVNALKNFLADVRIDHVFQQEPNGHASMELLLHNLHRKLDETTERIQYSLDLNAAREDFRTLQTKTQGLLNDAVKYLFYALSDRDKQRLGFSILGYHTTIDDALKASLHSRTGSLLKQLMGSTVIRAAVMPGGLEVGRRSPYSGEAVTLLKSGISDAYLDASGSANPALVGVLCGGRDGEVKASAAARKLDSDICQRFKGKEDLIAEFIQLHSLVGVFAEYSQLIESFWKLSGFGGDHLIYHQLAQVVRGLMSEFRVFNTAFCERFKAFSGLLATDFDAAVAAGNNAYWRVNYQQAQRLCDGMVRLTSECAQSLTSIIDKTAQTPDKYRRYRNAQLAYQQIQDAHLLVNRARMQSGLKTLPSTEFSSEWPQLPVNQKKRETASKAKTAAPQSPQIKFPSAIEDVIRPIAGTRCDQIDFLGEYKSDVLMPPGLSIWVGAWTRYRYFHDVGRFRILFTVIVSHRDRLFKNASEAKAALTSLKSAQAAVNIEFERIVKSRRALWWPFQRMTILFLVLWREIFNGAQEQITHLEAAAQAAYEMHIKQEKIAKYLPVLMGVFKRTALWAGDGLSFEAFSQASACIFKKYRDDGVLAQIASAARGYIDQIQKQGLGHATQSVMVEHVLVAQLGQQDLIDAYYIARFDYLLRQDGLVSLLCEKRLLQAIFKGENQALQNKIIDIIHEVIESEEDMSLVHDIYQAMRVLEIPELGSCMRACQLSYQPKVKDLLSELGLLNHSKAAGSDAETEVSDHKASYISEQLKEQQEMAARVYGQVMQVSP